MPSPALFEGQRHPSWRARASVGFYVRDRLAILCGEDGSISKSGNRTFGVPWSGKTFHAGLRASLIEGNIAVSKFLMALFTFGVGD